MAGLHERFLEQSPRYAQITGFEEALTQRRAVGVVRRVLTGVWSPRPVLLMLCKDFKTLREIHRDAIERWLEAVRKGESPTRMEQLKRAVASTVEDLLEHRKRHGC